MCSKTGKALEDIKVRQNAWRINSTGVALVLRVRQRTARGRTYTTVPRKSPLKRNQVFQQQREKNKQESRRRHQLLNRT